MPARETADSTGRVYLGIFLLFAPVGCLLGLMPPEPWAWGLGMFSAAFAGLIATGWAFAFQTARYWIIPFLVIIPALSGEIIFRPLVAIGLDRVGAGASPLERRIALMVASIVMLAAGFTLLMRHLALRERHAARMQTELDLAARIHRGLVPPIERRTARAEVLAVSHPSSEMGGDLIDIVPGEDADDLYLVDVSGHGVRAGILMAMIKSAARMRLLPGDAPVERIVSDLNRLVERVAEPDMFATMAWIRIGPGRRVEHALAGHLPILHWSARTRRLRDLENESLPLGVDGAERFRAGSFEAEAGDLLAVVTDGLTEAADGSGLLLGLGAVRSLVEGMGDAPLADIRTALLGAARRHGPQTDDQSILLARIG
jgi:serine phosphatase RsbU (regulator of sigma subunit)